MFRTFCIPGLIFLFAAFILNFLVSISVPYLPALDIVRVHFNDGDIKLSGQDTMSELRLGIWAPCYYGDNGQRTCIENGHGYAINIQVEEGGSKYGLNLGSAWTRGLAIHPVAAVAAFVALILSFFTNMTIALLSSVVSFFAALLTLIAFACDIALFAKLKKEISDLPGGGNFSTNPAPAFWMTLVAFILLLLAGCTVCFGRRKDRLSDATSSYPLGKTSFWSRFRRN